MIVVARTSSRLKLLVLVILVFIKIESQTWCGAHKNEVSQTLQSRNVVPNTPNDWRKATSGTLLRLNTLLLFFLLKTPRYSCDAVDNARVGPALALKIMFSASHSISLYAQGDATARTAFTFLSTVYRACELSTSVSISAQTHAHSCGISITQSLLLGRQEP